jgi:type III secretion protein J
MRRLLVAAAFLVGCSAPIHHELDEPQANEILTALERAGISAHKARDDNGSFVVSVGQADVLRSMELLGTLGLPRRRTTGFGEVYKQPSLVPTPTEERARYVEALAGEIGRTLETVDGVQSARVHLVLPESDPLATDGKPLFAAQAAVLLKTRTAHTPISELDVQKLVAGSVPGLDRAAVGVVVTSVHDAAASSCPSLTKIGPWRIAAESRATLLAAALAAGALVGVLAFLLLVAARRLAAAERRAKI